MGLFSKKKDTRKTDTSRVAITKDQDIKNDESIKSEKKKKANELEKKVLSKNTDGSLAYQFVIRPWITEKTHELMSSDKYVFKLRQKVTKNQAKSAIEKLYGVEVKKVNIVNIPQKKRRFGRVIGKKSGIKKAIVTLKEGNKIEVFE